jgi:hypothetical protein
MSSWISIRRRSNKTEFRYIKPMLGTAIARSQPRVNNRYHHNQEHGKPCLLEDLAVFLTLS